MRRCPSTKFYAFWICAVVKKKKKKIKKIPITFDWIFKQTVYPKGNITGLSYYSLQSRSALEEDKSYIIKRFLIYTDNKNEPISFKVITG